MSEGNRRQTVAVVEPVARRRASFPLSHPASVPMPAELQPPENRGDLPLTSEVTGGAALRVAEHEVAAWARRCVANGHGAEMLERLRRARRAIERGATLREVVCDGTLPGWRLRLALSEIAGDAIVNWDGRKGRTPVERLAVVRRATDEMLDAMACGEG